MNYTSDIESKIAKRAEMLKLLQEFDPEKISLRELYASLTFMPSVIAENIESLVENAKD